MIMFNETDKKNLLKNLAELKIEMATDTKQLSEQNMIKTLAATKELLDKKLQQIQEENRNIDARVKEETLSLSKARQCMDTLKNEISQLDAIEIKQTDKKWAIHSHA